MYWNLWMEFCWEFPEAWVKPLDKPPVFQISAWPSRCETSVSSSQRDTVSHRHVGMQLLGAGIGSLTRTGGVCDCKERWSEWILLLFLPTFGNTCGRVLYIPPLTNTRAIYTLYLDTHLGCADARIVKDLTRVADGLMIESNALCERGLHSLTIVTPALYLSSWDIIPQITSRDAKTLPLHIISDISDKQMQNWICLCYDTWHSNHFT